MENGKGSENILQIILFMRENGRMILSTEMEKRSIQVGTCIKVNSLMGSGVDMENMFAKMEGCMRENGRMTHRTEMEKMPMKMGMCMKVNSLMGSGLDVENSVGQMATCMREIGKIADDPVPVR